MKRVLLIINGPQPPFSEFADMFKPLVEASGQFEVEVSDDRNRLTDPSAFDAVALYIGGGEITPEVERGLTGYVRGGGGLLAVHGANAGLGQYDDYIELIGTEFIQHDPLAPFEVTTEDGFDDILPRLNKQFRIVDECYQMKVRTDAPLRYFQYGAWRLQNIRSAMCATTVTGRCFIPRLDTITALSAIQTFRTNCSKGCAM